MNAPFTATPETLVARRQMLRDNGYHPIPVLGKAPSLAAWQSLTAVSHQTIQQWSRSYRDAINTGILTGATAGVDVDVLEPTLSENIVSVAVDLFGPTPLRRVGRAPKTLLLYRLEAPHGKIATPDLWFGDDVSDKDKKAKVEILLVGQQVVVDGIHPDTNAPYCWLDQSPFDVPAKDVPPVTPELLKKFVAVAEQILRSAGARTEREIKASKNTSKQSSSTRGRFADAFHQANKPSRERVAELLEFIPNDKSYDDWIIIGFAIYDALGDGGADLWEAWSTHRREMVYLRKASN
jgi:hypothetical protein